MALSIMLVGLAGVIAAAPDGSGPRWLLVPALLVAGLGGGGVVSPNFTLTLQDVPPRMGGAAGGALQTGQRIGSALGAALLMSVFRVALAHGWAPQSALRLTLAGASVLVLAALALAVLDWRRDRSVAT